MPSFGVRAGLSLCSGKVAWDVSEKASGGLRSLHSFPFFAVLYPCHQGTIWAPSVTPPLDGNVEGQPPTLIPTPPHPLGLKTRRLLCRSHREILEGG